MKYTSKTTPTEIDTRAPDLTRHPAAVCGAGLLAQLLADRIIVEADWLSLSPSEREELSGPMHREVLLARLVARELLTPYQAGRIETGNTFGLLVGNYRILDRLGAGGMGVVFLAEHVYLRRLAAVKVLSLSFEQNHQLLQRFYGEMRVIAQLHHPNVAAALDAGEVAADDAGGRALHYLGMEYVPGEDLEKSVQARGVFSVARACDVSYQVACALAEAHRHHLVHRDVKPSNVMVTPEGQAKLLDFGLARQFGTRLTDPGVLLGSIDFMAPEQAVDARAVDVRADVYGLGGTIFWCLTGQPPFPPQENVVQALAQRQSARPPSVRHLRPDLPVELDTVLTRMLATRPDDRYSTPEAVMTALRPFLAPEALPERWLTAAAAKTSSVPLATMQPRVHRILIIDDEEGIRRLCGLTFRSDEFQCDEAVDGIQALEAIARTPYDLALLDVDMPNVSGKEVLVQLRHSPPSPHFKVIMMSGRVGGDDMARMLAAGADDYLTKPFSVVQVRARVEAALRLKDAQDLADRLNRDLLTVNAELELNLDARDSDLVQARNALILSLAKLVERRGTETGTHLLRLQRYCRCLAEAAAGSPHFKGQIDPHFVTMLECCAPLHDVGKAALPDHILLKPGKYDAEERIAMQCHTLIGADTLAAVARQHGSSLVFLQTAIDVTRHHHERYDGTGYPDRLTGNAIPLTARIVTIGDVYDALRSRRPYRPALSHAAALEVMCDVAARQFDPHLFQAFEHCATQFDGIFRELS